MAVPLGQGEVTIEILGPLVSRPYVEMTGAMMRLFGAEVRTPSASHFIIPGRQEYRQRRYTIEPDAAAASYFFAAAAIAGARLTALDLPEKSRTGDVLP